jgi:hypothetical protein
MIFSCSVALFATDGLSCSLTGGWFLCGLRHYRGFSENRGLEKSMNQEALDRLRVLLDSSSRCQCGGNCELLQDLAAKVLDIQVHEVGFEIQCPVCNELLAFHSPNRLSLYTCERCQKRFRYEPGGAIIEIELNPQRPGGSLISDYQ